MYHLLWQNFMEAMGECLDKGWQFVSFFFFYSELGSSWRLPSFLVNVLSVTIKTEQRVRNREEDRERGREFGAMALGLIVLSFSLCSYSSMCMFNKILCNHHRWYILNLQLKYINDIFSLEGVCSFHVVYCEVTVQVRKNYVRALGFKVTAVILLLGYLWVGFIFASFSDLKKIDRPYHLFCFYNIYYKAVLPCNK